MSNFLGSVQSASDAPVRLFIVFFAQSKTEHCRLSVAHKKREPQSQNRKRINNICSRISRRTRAAPPYKNLVNNIVQCRDQHADNTRNSKMPHKPPDFFTPQVITFHKIPQEKRNPQKKSSPKTCPNWTYAFSCSLDRLLYFYLLPPIVSNFFILCKRLGKGFSTEF